MRARVRRVGPPVGVSFRAQELVFELAHAGLEALDVVHERLEVLLRAGLLGSLFAVVVVRTRELCRTACDVAVSIVSGMAFQHVVPFLDRPSSS